MAKKAEKPVKKEKVPNVYLYVYIPKTQKDAFEDIANEKGTTLSALMRNVLEDYLRKTKPAWS